MQWTCRPLEAMNKPRHFEIKEDYALYRPAGEFTLEEAVQLVTSVITFAREHHIKKLLVDLTGLAPIEPPNLASRYFFVRDWAHAAQGKVRIALTARPEVIDFEKIGTIIAENAGLRCNVYESEEEALAWLQSTKRAGQSPKTHFTRG